MLDVESLREFEAFLAGREERGWIRKQCPQAGFHAFCVIGIVEGRLRFVHRVFLAAVVTARPLPRICISNAN